MSRDDDTPSQRPRRRQWIASDTERVNVGAEHRRAETAGMTSESRRRAALVQSIEERLDAPGDAIDDDITAPHALFERDLSPAEIAIIQQSARNSGDYATVADVVKLAETLTRARRQERSNNTERDQQLVTLLGSKPGDMLQRFTRMEASVKSHNRLVKTGLGIAAASLVAVGTFLYTRGLNEGGAAVRMNYMERALDRVVEDVRALTRHTDNGTTPAPLAFTTKDSP